MRKCKTCSKEFEPVKSYYFLCSECFPKAVGCKTCKKILIPNDKNEVSCCGHISTLEEIRDVERFNRKQIADALNKVGLFKPLEDYASEMDFI